MFNSGPEIFLPDTVIYKYEQPAFWYFTTTKAKNDFYSLKTVKSDGRPRILKKKKAKLSNKEIEAAFLRKGTIGPSGIVAVYFYYKPDSTKISEENNLLKALNEKRSSKMGNSEINKSTFYTEGALG
jgi:hypothetical protein